MREIWRGRFAESSKFWQNLAWIFAIFYVNRRIFGRFSHIWANRRI
ncbi:hypothetical protein ACWIUD_02825 [Helicobacter sp. 23-1044]